MYARSTARLAHALALAVSAAALAAPLVACDDGDAKSTAPTIANLQIEDRTIRVGIPVTMAGSLGVTAPNGDLAMLHLAMKRPDGSAFGALDVPITGAQGQTTGTLPYTFDFTADVVGRYTIEAWVTDGAGQDSNHLTTTTSEVTAAAAEPSLANLHATIPDVKVGLAARLTGTVDFTDGDGNLTTLVVTVKRFDTTVLATARVPVTDVTGVLAGTAPFAIDITADAVGAHTLEVAAEDASGGNARPVSQTFTVSASTTAPQIRNFDMDNARAYVGIASELPIAFDFTDSDGNVTTLHARVKDAAGATALEREVALAVTGQTTGAVATSVMFTATSAGRYTLEVWVEDAAHELSNHSTLTFDAVTPDSTAPALFGLALDAGPAIYAAKAATLAGSAKFTDIDGNVATLVTRLVRPDGSALAETTTNLTTLAGKTSGEVAFSLAFTLDRVGFHTLELWVEDADSQASGHLTRGVSIDTSATAPEISTLRLFQTTTVVGVGVALGGEVDVADSDKNVKTLHMLVADPTGATLAETTKDASGLAGFASGSIPFSPMVTAAGAGRHSLTVWVVDALGETSARLTLTFDAIATSTTPTLPNLTVSVPTVFVVTPAMLSGIASFADIDANVAKLHLKVTRPAGTTLVERTDTPSVSGQATGTIAFDLTVTPDIVGTHRLEVWAEDAAGQLSSKQIKTFVAVDTRPVVKKVNVVHEQLFVTKTSTISGSVEFTDADGNPAVVRVQLARPDGSTWPVTAIELVDAAGQTVGTTTFAFDVTPDVAGTHTLNAWVEDADGQASAHATYPVVVGDTSQVASACSALGTDCTGKGFCYDVGSTTCAYFEDHALTPPEVCDEVGTTGTEALCVSSTTDPASPLVTDDNRCKFVQFWSYPTDFPMDCRCPEAHFDQRCMRPYFTSQATTFGTGPRIRSLAGTVHPWRGLVVGREWLLPIAWSTASRPNETMIFAVNLDTGNRRHFSGAWDDPANGYSEVGTGDKFVQIMDIKKGPASEPNSLYAVGATSDIAAPKLWRIDATTGARTKIFDEETASPSSLCPNLSTLPGRTTVQMTTEGWAIDSQGRFYFSNIGMPGPSILRLTVAGVGGAAATQCEYLTRVMDCPTCSVQANVGAGYDSIQFDLKAFEIKDDKLFAVSDKRFLSVELATGRRALLSYANDVGAIGTGPINAEGLADRWTTWDSTRGVFWTVGILGGSMAVTVDPTTGDRAAWPCYHTTRGVLEGCGGTGMPLVPGPLNFGGMVIDPLPPHDLYFAHDLFAVVKYEVTTGNSYIFSL